MVIPRKDFNWENLVTFQMPKFCLFFLSTDLAILRCSSARNGSLLSKDHGGTRSAVWDASPWDCNILTKILLSSQPQTINCSMALCGLLVLFPEATRTATKVGWWTENLLLKLFGDSVSLLWPLNELCHGGTLPSKAAYCIQLPFLLSELGKCQCTSRRLRKSYRGCWRAGIMAARQAWLLEEQVLTLALPPRLSNA